MIGYFITFIILLVQKFKCKSKNNNKTNLVLRNFLNRQKHPIY